MNGHVAAQLSAFFDGELEERERAAVAQHLEACAECARQLEELSAVDRLASGVPVVAPEGYFDSFASRVRDRIRKPPRRSLALPAWALTTAAALLLAVSVPALLRRQLQVPPPAQTRAPAAPPATMSAVPQSADSQEALRSLGYVQGGRAAQDQRADSPALKREEQKKAPLKDEAPSGPSLHAKIAAPTPAPALPPPAAAAPQAGSLAMPQAEADTRARDEATPRAEAEAAGEERKQRAETLEKAQAAGFAEAPTEGQPLQAEPPRRPLQSTAEPSRQALQNTAPSAAFRALLARRSVTIAEARGLREAWRAFAQGATGTEADEAGVRVIESGRDAFRLSGEEADLEQARRDAAAYLKREDALQADRVRALLRGLSR